MTFGLIGHPLSHSFSRRYFTEKFAKLGLADTHRYLNFDIEDFRGFDQFLAEHPDLRGCNVTIPHKQNVLPFLDELDERSAGRIGAVNTILFEDGQTKGFNTDYVGFRKDLLSYWQPPKDCKALVLGTGGASLAVHVALHDLDIDTTAVSRRPGPNRLTYEQVTEEVLAEQLLIVNTTPLGMYPKVEAAPALPYEALSEQHFCYDLVYNPEITRFLKRAQERGAGTANGQGMLVGQAEAAWAIWTQK